jgi:hypothetical protein
MSSQHVKIIEEFRSHHRVGTHVARGAQFFASTCPFCQTICQEQTDAYASVLEELMAPIVERHWNKWDRSGYSIANNTHPDTLNGSLSFNAFARWIQPRYYDIPIENDELYHHSYVSRKIMRS